MLGAPELRLVERKVRIVAASAAAAFANRSFAQSGFMSRLIGVI